MRKLIKANRTKEQGSAMLITTIILLVLMVIVATAISISGMQFDLAMLNRNTSNTYYLAKSAVEKQVDTMNKAVESELSKLVKEISPTYINALVNLDDSLVAYDNVSKKIKVIEAELRDTLQLKIYNYLKKNYMTRIVNTPPSPIDYPALDAKDPIVYNVQSDRVEDGYYTEIKIIITDKDDTGVQLTNSNWRVIATATTKSSSSPGTIYDQQTVEGIINVKLPASPIDNQIHEKYAFASSAPEIFSSAIISFSDVIVKDGGQLMVTGDMQVGGPQDIAGYVADPVNWPGVYEYPEADQNGGVIAMNGGKIDITGNLYCTNNVLATNGWGAASYGAGPSDTINTNDTKINVTGDIIAYTVGIVDDYYKHSANQSPFSTTKQVSDTWIKAQRNIMVDNDVMIDRWVNGCTITAGKTIFGINAGADYATNVDPNQSSGVFSQGTGSQIISERMYVAGQPYITLASNKNPLKLWESIGEPFNGIASFAGYATFSENAANSKYLDPDSPLIGLIANDKIKTDFSKSYAVASVSGFDTNTSSKRTGINTCYHIFNKIESGGTVKNQGAALRFFYQGPYASDAFKFEDFMKDGNTPTYTSYTTDVQKIIKDIEDYTKGNKDGFFNNIGMNLPANNYRGLRGYMTLKRSVFYNGFVASGITDAGKPIKTKFTPGASEVGAFKNSALPNAGNTWSYATPIYVVNGGTINLKDFYVDEGTGSYQPYPSIIINYGKDKKLTIKADTTDRKQFKGIIISQGPVETIGDLTITGTVIIGGPEDMPDPKNEASLPSPSASPTPSASPSPTIENRKDIFDGKYAGLIINNGTVTINSDPNVINTISVKNHALYRQILDFLYCTDYTSKIKVSDIIAKQGNYTKPILKYTNESILEVDTEGIEVAIKSLKKTQ